jgi:DinB superfamily
MIQKLLVCAFLSAAAIPAQTTLTATATTRYFAGVRRNLEASADAMPADKYSFRLTDGQMTFREWLIHSAQRNYIDCSTLKGETAPKTDADIAALKGKAGVSQTLKDSFSYCAAVIEKLDDAKVLASPQLTYSFLHIIVHNNEVYGNIVGYLRASGIVPPSTAGRALK